MHRIIYRFALLLAISAGLIACNHNDKKLVAGKLMMSITRRSLHRIQLQVAKHIKAHLSIRWMKPIPMKCLA